MTIDVVGILADSGGTAPIRDRVELILRHFRAATGRDAEDAFVSEYVTKSESGSQRVYESLYLFFGQQFYEAKNFLKETNLDCVHLSSFAYWQLISTEFDDFTDATTESRLSIELAARSYTGISAKLQASGKNCNRLARIFRERILPVVGNTPS
jgi:hypothetical protein